MPDWSVNEVLEIRKRLSALSKNGDEHEKLRQQLMERLEELTKDKTLSERIEPLLIWADEIGEVDPDFDVKAYLDELWDDI